MSPSFIVIVGGNNRHDIRGVGMMIPPMSIVCAVPLRRHIPHDDVDVDDEDGIIIIVVIVVTRR